MRFLLNISPMLTFVLFAAFMLKHLAAFRIIDSLFPCYNELEFRRVICWKMSVHLCPLRVRLLPPKILLHLSNLISISLHMKQAMISFAMSRDSLLLLLLLMMMMMISSLLDRHLRSQHRQWVASFLFHHRLVVQHFPRLSLIRLHQVYHQHLRWHCYCV